MRKRKKKRGLTDKIFIAVTIFVMIVFIYSGFLMLLLKDASALGYLIGSASGFGTIVLTAIVNKNTKENINKHSINEEDEKREI